MRGLLELLIVVDAECTDTRARARTADLGKEKAGGRAAENAESGQAMVVRQAYANTESVNL